MHALTGGKANVKVRNVDAAAKACELMGFTIDTHGKQEQTGQWWTVRWATLAMLDHKTTGLMDFPVKGWWVLTPAGAAAANGTPFTVAPVAPTPAPVAPVAPAPAPVAVAPAAPAPAVVELLTNIPDTTDQLVDSYLLSLQMAATPCFGNWSAKSDSCKGCVLASRCFDGMLTKLADMADSLPLVEQPKQTIPWSTTQAAPQAAMASSAHATQTTKSKVPLSAATAALDPSAFGVAVQAAAVNPPPLDVDNTPPTPKYVEMALIADANCVHCGKVIREGEMGAYSRKKGFAHVACVNKGVKP